MQSARPYVVVNCLSQGYAVAGPPEDCLRGEDFEMVQWGMTEPDAVKLRDKLNTEAKKPAQLKRLHD